MAELPSTLESPPRTTGNPQTDLPILIDWFWKAYQVIQQSVLFINEEVSPTIITVANLPDPDGTTLEEAQQTANDAFSLATANAIRLDGFISGTFLVENTDVGAVLTFATPQVDTSYRVIIQPISFTGTPATNAFLLKTKTYTTDDFTAIMLAAPGASNSITFEWQLIRND